VKPNILLQPKPFFFPLSLGLFLALFSTCGSNAVLQSKTYLFEENKTQKTLLVFLPGRGGSMDDLANEGLLDTLKERHLPFDLVSVNATTPYYMARTLPKRLEKDVFATLKTKGYADLWLFGNSMGGLGSLLFARNHPGMFKGIILLGPFLGDAPIVNEVGKSGGLAVWVPKDTLHDDYQRDVWTYLAKCTRDTNGNYPELFLLAGNNDRFKQAQSILAAAMKKDHVFYAQGGHDWFAWRAAWSEFLKMQGKNFFDK
jgi:pimeloyl-ACP methyl ester carboxylesterase